MDLQSDREKGAHLLRRFGLGASEAELDFYLKDGLGGAIDRLVEYDSHPDTFTVEPNDLQASDKGLNLGYLVAWWSGKLIGTQRPLQEKMTVFWHDHFATSADKVKASGLMLQQNEILRENATGNFRTLLKAVSADPAMLLWLDNQENTKGHPNENFAREVMELFTLGIGNYTEHDIQEAARAFTGWSFKYRSREESQAAGYRLSDFVLRDKLHDNGSKTVFDVSGNLSGNDVLDVLCNRPRTAYYITEKIIKWFVMPNPSPDYVQRMAAVFAQSKLDTASLLKAIMKSSEFYSAAAVRSVIKNPVDFCVAIARQMGIGARFENLPKDSEVSRRAVLAPAMVTTLAMKNMGMHLMYPPDVAGWDGGQSWISSGTMVERIAWGDRIFGLATGGARVNIARYPAIQLLNGANTPDAVVSRLVSVYDAPVTDAHRAILRDAAAKAMGSGITAANANRVCAAVSRLIFATPEFQFA